MINLSNYIRIYEANAPVLTRGESQIPNSAALIDMYKAEFGDKWFERCSNKNLRGSAKHTHELVRGFFGEDVDTFERSVSSFLVNQLRVDRSDFELQYSEHNTDASGSYPSIKITFKDDVDKPRIKCRAGSWLYVINTNSKIQKKQLTPDKLGFATKDNEYMSVAGIKEQLDAYKSDTIALDTLQNLIDEIIVSKSGKKYETLDELMGGNNKYIRKITKLDFEKQDIANLVNDFGEILGPCFLLSKLEGEHKVKFPTESNAKLYDYILDKALYISAKAGRGAAPSSVTMAQKAMTLVEGTKDTDPLFNKEDGGSDTFYIDTIIPILADETKASKKDSAIIKCQFRLLEALSQKHGGKFTEVIDMLKGAGIMYDKTSYMLPRENIGKMHADGKLSEFLEKLYVLLEYKPSDKFSIKNINEKWDSFKNIDEGCIVYPIRAAIVKFINEKYANDITFWAKRAIEGYQLYITYNAKESQLEISLVNFGDGEYTLEPSGSVSEPRLKAIACRKK